MEAVLYLSGIILSFFLFFLLGTKKYKTQGDFILLTWLAVLGLHLLTFYLFFTQQYEKIPSIIVLGFSFPLAHGPFLFLYTTQQTSKRKFRKTQLLHFIPVLLSVFLFAKYYALSPEQKIEVFRQKGAGFETELFINVGAIYLSGIIYISLSLSRLLKYRRRIVDIFSNTEKINFNWLLYLIVWMSVIWIVILVIKKDEFIFAAAALFIFWLGYFGIKQVQVFQTKRDSVGEDKNDDASVTLDFENEEENNSESSNDNSSALKYQKSTLTDQEVNRIHERLNQLMDNEKPFINPELTLNELAKSLSVHPNHLSQVINSRENKNFYDLINEKRVKEFIKISTSPISQQFTLLALAFDCGFNSKASFNRNFKKFMQVTPSEYLKQRQ